MARTRAPADGKKVKREFAREDRPTAPRTAKTTDAEKRGAHRFVVRGFEELAEWAANPEGFQPSTRSQSLNLIAGVADQTVDDMVHKNGASRYRQPALNQAEYAENYLPLGRGGLGARRWGRWGQVSTTGREITEYGYAPIILDQDIKYLLERDPTAKFIIESVAQDTWREWFKIDDEYLDTIFTELKKLGAVERYAAADASNRGYGFGLLVFGFNDGAEPDQPLGKVKKPKVTIETVEPDEVADARRKALKPREAPAQPAVPTDGEPGATPQAPADEATEPPGDEEAPPIGRRRVDLSDSVLFIEYYPFEEVDDFKFDKNSESKTFGEIIQYKVKESSGDNTRTRWIHASRCIPFKEDLTSKWPVGRRVLESVYDSLQLLRQMEWAAAEGYYQRVVPPIVVTVQEGFVWNQAARDKVDKAVTEFKTGVREYLGIQGVDVEVLGAAAQVLDPENTFRMLVSRIAAGTGIPARKLILAAKGAVSESKEDRREYEQMIDRRRGTFGESRVRATITLLTNAGVLSEDDIDDYEINWPPITPQSKDEAAATEAAFANARAMYIRERIPLPEELAYDPTTDPEMVELTTRPKENPLATLMPGQPGPGAKPGGAPASKAAGTTAPGGGPDSKGVAPAAKPSANLRDLTEFEGLPIVLERIRGSVRKGVDADGVPWAKIMTADYGYVRGTSGADAEGIDVYIGPDINAPYVFIINQKKRDGTFDEHKVMLGYQAYEQAIEAYLYHAPDWMDLGAVLRLPRYEFPEWVHSKAVMKAVNVAVNQTPMDEGRVDQTDQEVDLKLDDYENRVQSILHGIAQPVLADVSAKVDALPDDFGMGDLDDLFPTEFTEETLMTLVGTLVDIARESAGDLDRAIHVAIPTANHYSMNIGETGKALMVHAHTTSTKFLQDSIAAAKQALASAFKSRLPRETLLDEVRGSISGFFKGAIRRIANALGITAFNLGRDEVLMANRPVLKYVEFRNPLDKDTTQICRDRAKFQKGDRGIVVVTGSFDYYHNLAPLHFGCRSWWSPLLRLGELTPAASADIRRLTPKTPGF